MSVSAAGLAFPPTPSVPADAERSRRRRAFPATPSVPAFVVAFPPTPSVPAFVVAFQPTPSVPAAGIVARSRELRYR